MTGKTDNLTLAIGAILVAVFALSLGDAAIKGASAQIPLGQIFVLRSLIALPVLVILVAMRVPPAAWRPARPGWTGLRSLMLAVMWVAYYAALPHVALSVAAAVYYTTPLIIVLIAALFAGERAGRAGWLAVAIGFAGVLLILRPGGGDLNPWAFLPLVSAILYAVSMVLTRTKCRDEHPLILSLALNRALVAVGAAASGLAQLGGGAAGFLSGAWVAMGPAEWLLMAGLALATLAGSIGAAIAYQSGPASTVAAFDFAYLAFAGFWGVVLFAEVPDPPALAGIALIAIGGLIAVRRRTGPSVRPAAPPGAPRR